MIFFAKILEMTKKFTNKTPIIAHLSFNNNISWCVR